MSCIKGTESGIFNNTPFTDIVEHKPIIIIIYSYLVYWKLDLPSRKTANLITIIILAEIN